MIEFIEKEPYFDNSHFTGQCYMYPTYMVKDGKEYFMFNRRDPDDSWVMKQIDARKAQLIMTDGKYFTFYGYQCDPFDFLADVIERKHHFDNPNSLYFEDEVRDFIDFGGNLREVAAAFMYRIYDRDLAEKIKRVAELINKEAWEDAESERVR